MKKLIPLVVLLIFVSLPQIISAHDVAQSGTATLHGHIIPNEAGVDAPSSDRVHTHAYPKLMLAEAAIFTVVMGYFLFANKKPKFLR